MKFLCTSREVLGIQGEAILSLQPFQMREADKIADGLEGNPAVELFLDRARNARFDFTLDDRVFREILALCRELDALPLAIEIMAAWAGTWSVSEMRENVKNQHLAARKKYPDLRHQSLEACIGWSFQLLDSASQRDLCILSLFRGGFTSEAAAKLLNIPNIDSVLAVFLDKSLISSVEVESRRRFSMLEMVREYCQHRLDPLSAQQAAPRLVAYLREQAAILTNPCVGAEEAANHRMLDRERENVEAAVELCEAGLASVDDGLGLLGAMELHWAYRGQILDGRALLRRLLALPKGEVGLGRVMGLQTLSILSQTIDDFAQSQLCLQEMEEISKQLGDPQAKFRVLNQIGNLHNRLAQFEEASRSHREALELAEMIGNTRFQAASHSNLAEALFALDLRKEAIGHWQIAAELDLENGNTAGEATLFLGFSYCVEGRYEIGAQKLEQYLSSASQLNFARGIARAVYFAVFPANGLGLSELSETLHNSALEYIREQGVVLDAIERKCTAIVENRLPTHPHEHLTRPADIGEAVELALTFLSELAVMSTASSERFSSESRNSNKSGEQR